MALASRQAPLILMRCEWGAGRRTLLLPKCFRSQAKQLGRAKLKLFKSS
jgi:hypothetical protein